MKTTLQTIAAAALAILSATAAHADPDSITIDNDLVITNTGPTKERAQYVHSGTPAIAGTYKWYFNTDNFPTGPNAQGYQGLAEALTVDGVVGMIQLAMSRWSQMCNVQFQYMGLTSAQVNVNDGINTIGFASFARIAPGIGYAAGAAFPFVSGNTLTDADIGINIDNHTTGYWDQRGIDGLISHEVGHVLGLAHSDVQASVMFSNPINGNQYMQRLRADDVAACTAIYGAAPNQLINRTLNWAESVYPNETNNGYNSPSTQIGYGYVYRAYGNSKTYAGSKDGRAYYMGPDGKIQDMGLLMDFAGRVQAAGF